MIVFFNFSFKMQNDLRRHQQTHSAVYTYTCEEEGCNYAAKALQSLRRHHKIWHEVQIYNTVVLLVVDQNNQKFQFLPKR